MKTLLEPQKQDWESLCKRPTFNAIDLTEKVTEILQTVKKQGDSSLFNYTEQFDRVRLNSLSVSPEEFKLAEQQVPTELKKSIDLAYQNIYAFHAAQREESSVIETTPGVKCWRKSLPIETVGLYIPGGTAPLFSTLLMLGIPAQIAGCQEIIVVSPPQKNGEIDPAILYVAQLVGTQKVFKLGGAQAIAALAFGTESIPKVNKILGPGNQFVTRAKELVRERGVAIDLPAGPSEVLVIADATCVPEYVAADLLSQAEHGEDSQVMLVTTQQDLANKIRLEVAIQLEKLQRKEVAQKALENSKVIVFNQIENCFDFSNCYAPEHLIIASENAANYSNWVINAGSVFLGNFSCESAGDYASGTNHTLPTNGFAKNYSGVSLDTFMKKITFQELSAAGLQSIGKAIEIMAEAEQLQAHKNAVTLRIKNSQNNEY